jgi:hypothetical protein
MPARVGTGAGSQQLVRGDGQVADAFAGGVVDRVGDGRRHPDDGQLGKPLRLQGVDVRVVLINEERLQGGNVGMLSYRVSFGPSQTARVACGSSFSLCFLPLICNVRGRATGRSRLSR